MADSGDIVIVGVCGSGKSELVHGLLALGYPARAVAQEHSYVPGLWARRGRPQALIYLEAGLETVRRRLDVRWEEGALELQRERLAQARRQCDIAIDTDPLTIEQVLAEAVAQLRELGLDGTPRPPTT